METLNIAILDDDKTKLNLFNKMIKIQKYIMIITLTIF